MRKGSSASHGAIFFASWLLALWGVVQIVCNSKLFRAFREAWNSWWLRLPIGVDSKTIPVAERPEPRSALMASFFYCPMCVGWWTGAFLHLAGFGALEGGPLALVLDGAAASGWCWFVYVLHKLGTTSLKKMGVTL